MLIKITKFISGIFILLFTGLIVAFRPGTLKEKTPNIVIIFMDDMGYGDHTTPNMDKLAARGMRFTNFYAASLFALLHVQEFLQDLL